jgi:hypothetical protein
MRYFISILFLALVLTSCKKVIPIDPKHEIVIDSVFVNNEFVADSDAIKNVDYVDVVIDISFSEPVDTTIFDKENIYITNGIGTAYTYHFDRLAQKLTLLLDEDLAPLSSYDLIVDPGLNMGGTIYQRYIASFRTMMDTTLKFPKISDDSLLTLVQNRTFGYFWDYAHPTSGLSRERLGSGNIVTTGGSGFGLMAVLTGIKRGFILRQAGFERLNKVVNFLINPETERFHGVFPHWMNGSTGKVVPFSTNDNGGDLVETAFLMQGLLTVREYFKNGSSEEKSMCDSITKLWEDVDWNWYQHNGQNILYWHWSPDKGWIINMGIRGWNEALIIYVLAASSPTHSITKAVYTNGWANNGAIVNRRSYYGIILPFGLNYGGPLFFAHYSFLGLDPRNLNDQYASYWEQNVAHSEINHAYCKANPKGYDGYADNSWGLTASDIPSGYSASSPTNDLGVIAPTAALSSFPYTPVESMKAMKFFYYIVGDKLWGQYGFHDSFNLSKKWFAGSYLAIDQGPIICMIENYRSAFLWNLFMSNPEIKAGLDKLGFTY